jgi:hypothetical protein
MKTKSMLRRAVRAKSEADRLLLDRKQAEEKAAEEAAKANEDVRAAEIRRWRAWMAEHRPNGLDPLHDCLKAFAAYASPKIVELRDARREALDALGREPTDEELQPFLEDVALEIEFRAKYGRAATWLEHVARFGREPSSQLPLEKTLAAFRDQIDGEDKDPQQMEVTHDQQH